MLPSTSAESLFVVVFVLGAGVIIGIGAGAGAFVKIGNEDSSGGVSFSSLAPFIYHSTSYLP